MNVKVKQCFVPYCGNNSFKTPDKVFISTPSNSTRRQEWFRAASNAYNKPLRVLITSYCCEDHFDPITDFANWMEFKTVGTRLKVLSNTIPHIFKKKPVLIAEGNSLFLRYLVKRRKRNNSDHESHFEEELSGSEITNKSVKQMCNVSVQTNIQLENIEANTESINKISTDANTLNKNYECATNKSVTGHVLTVSNIFNEVEPHNSSQDDNVTNYCTLIERQSRFYIGLSKEQYFLVKLLSEKINCSYVNVLITLRKIRLNDPFDRLSSDFALPETSTREIFMCTVPKMAELLKSFIIWPAHSNTLLNLPVQYRTRSVNVQTVIDFFETQIENPSTCIKHLLTCSKHKNIHTMKYLISINPDGLINFISPGYGGRTSQIEIIKHCEYLDVLPHNTTILSSNNLTELTTLLAVKNCKLVTNITTDEQLKERAAKDSKQITTLIRQINATISKLSEFQILNSNSCIEKSCIHLLDFILIISCGLVNLQEPAD